MQSISFQQIRDNIIGEHTRIETPFGTKPLVYADYTASGRSLRFIEDFIQYKVLPFYANTHSESSFTGRQSTVLREQARQMVRQGLRADDSYQVIFTGSGATAAINKLIAMLNLALPAQLDSEYGFQQQIAEQDRPVVFIGPYEHHSNELPWRESIATLVRIPLTRQGQLDLQVLEQKLQQYQNRSLKIGSFSAASNVTGIKTDILAVTELLHSYQALSFWDYAAAGPYVGIDLQTSQADALFISPHKYIGGPGTPGLLVVHNRVINNSVPAVPGGGTVVYVTPEDHQYVADAERREEGGTPAIVESIRAGLVFQLQQQVGTDVIEHNEHRLIQNLLWRWADQPNIQVLGNTEVERLSICSFQVLHRDQQGQSKPLHYGFIVALLNDLFGIQARGGCSCAGPYGHELLGLDMATSKALEQQILSGNGVLRPGWVRINLNYFIDEPTADYLASAIELVAEHGWRLLPYYRFDAQQGVWRYQGQQTELPVDLADAQSWLLGEDDGLREGSIPSESNMPGESNKLHESSKWGAGNQATAVDYSELLAQGEARLTQPRGEMTYSLELSDVAKELCWFALPQEMDFRNECF